MPYTSAGNVKENSQDTEYPKKGVGTIKKTGEWVKGFWYPYIDPEPKEEKMAGRPKKDKLMQLIEDYRKLRKELQELKKEIIKAIEAD